MSELYRDFINTNMNDVITALNGTITPTPVNSELYRDFLNRKADDVITALNGSITPAPAGDELYRDFIERKFDDVIAGIGGYVPPVSFPTLTGSIVTFNSQYALPLKSHIVDIDSVSGVSAINIGNTNAYDTNIEQGTLDSSGLNAYAINRIRTADYIPVVSGHTYKITLIGSGNYNLGVSGYTANDYATARTQSTAWISNNADLLIDAGIKYIRINVRFMTNTNITPADLTGILITDITNYYTIQIGSTVNKATYNARTGILEVTQPSVQTLQLPPCPIDTLEGVNNIWADTGDTTLQYIKIGGNT